MKKYHSLEEIKKNANLKFLKIFPSPSLSLRAQLTFLIFGLIIGYITLITITMISTRSYIEMASRGFINHYNKVIDLNEKDIYLELIKDNNIDILKHTKEIETAISNLLKISDIQLYYRDHSDRLWKKPVQPEGSAGIKIQTILGEETGILNRAARHNLTTSSPIFLGKSDKITIFINLTKEIDKNSYLLSVTADRKGLAALFKDNITHFTAFTILLIVISIVLGKIFSIFLIRPVKELSVQASELSSGNFKFRFNLKRGDEIGILADSLNIMAEKIETHVGEIERRMNTMETMNNIDKAVLSSISRNDLLKRVVNIVSELFQGNKIIMTIRNNDREGFDILTFGDREITGLLGDTTFFSDEDLGEELKTQLTKLNQMTYPDINKNLYSLVKGLDKMGIGSIINVPVFISEKFLGSLAMTRLSREKYLPEEIDSIRMLADQVGVALQSVMSFEEKEDLLLGILLSLTKAIDAKSEWTAGHSERVAKHAEKIAVKMNFNEKDLRNITISAILHDIGKISVPEVILDKAGKLSDEEYGRIKQHPERGAEIIEDIQAYDRILPGILYHHERWDGQGYPFGLKEKQIPLISRIITVADVYDAITDDRPYRKGMSAEESINFMVDNRGKIFDPGIVDTFLELLKAEKTI